MYWDEDTRLMVLSDNGKTSRYTYNAAGERIVKSHGDLEGVYINGAPQGISFHETEDYTIYPAPIITVTKNRFTKHYFIGSKRIASKIGTGRFSNVYGIGGNNITAGQKDYAARMMQIEKQREEYYKQLGTPPGVPTMKGATADPDNTGIGYNSIITDLGDHSVPEGWIQHPKFNGKGDVPGPPIQWSEPESPNNAQPGYGYIPADTTDTEDIFFYHSDHLGSTSYITDAKANITQFDAYLPYGELLVDEHTSSEDMPYKFNGKEFDEETGLYYYGARYYDPRVSLWMSTDPEQNKYPQYTSYLFVGSNPINAIDPDGRKIIFINGKIGGGSPKAGAPYWNGINSNFVKGAKSFFNDKKVTFTNADYGYLSSAKEREKLGYKYAKSHYKQWISNMKSDEAFNLVSHSMGGAFSKGIEEYLKEMGRKVKYNVMINTFQVDRIDNLKSSETLYIDYQNTNDPVLFWFDINLGLGSLKNSDVKIREKSENVETKYIHRSPIDVDSKFWEKIKSNLPPMRTN